jgi:glutamine synthetase
MNKTNITERPETEDDEPMSLPQLLGTAVQEATAGESAEFLADDFMFEFVEKGREEVPQILMFLDMPNETIIHTLVDSQVQALEVFKQNAPAYLNELRATVKKRLSNFANTKTVLP